MATLHKDTVTTDKGATLVESTIVLSVLTFLIFTGLYIIIAVYQMLALEHAMAKTARTASLAGGGGAERVEAIKSWAKTQAQAYGVTLNDQSIRVCLAEDEDCREAEPGEPGESAGAGNQFIAVGVHHNIELASLVTIPYRFEVITRNEPPF